MKVTTTRKSDGQHGITAKNKAIRQARLQREMAKSALTFKRRGRYARRHPNAA